MCAERKHVKLKRCRGKEPPSAEVRFLFESVCRPTSSMTKRETRIERKTCGTGRVAGSKVLLPAGGDYSRGGGRNMRVRGRFFPDRLAGKGRGEIGKKKTRN